MPEKHKFSGTNEKPERRRPFGTGLVRHCPQGLFWPFFTFLRALFFRLFRLSLASTICPWVSEDAVFAVVAVATVVIVFAVIVVVVTFVAVVTLAFVVYLVPFVLVTVFQDVQTE